MRNNMLKVFCSVLYVMGCLAFYACAQQNPKETADETPLLSDSLYTFAPSTSTDGSGKFYMGREIAQVMGHLGAGWLERSSRESEERTDLLIQALSLQKDDVVADIGAGTGYFTFQMSEQVPQGKVLAVDIQPEMLTLMQKTIAQKNVNNVKTLLGTEQNPQLPTDSVDLVLIVDAYHEFSYPREMMENIVNALQDGGRVVLAEYRAEDPEVNIKPTHKMTEQQVVKEMAAVGLALEENKDILPQQHLMFFVKAK